MDNLQKNSGEKACTELKYPFAEGELSVNETGNAVSGIDLYVSQLWEVNPEIYNILISASEVENARDELFFYIESEERNILYNSENKEHQLEKVIRRECITVLKNVFAPVNEKSTGDSALNILWEIANGNESILKSVSLGFIIEFIHLFKGISGKAGLYKKPGSSKNTIPEFLNLEGREAAIERNKSLNDISAEMNKFFDRYPSGLEKNVIEKRKDNMERIKKYFNAGKKEWYNYNWQLKNVIKDADILSRIVEISPEQKKAVSDAVKYRIPFGITPYYLSLMDRKNSSGNDFAVRIQVIPTCGYIDQMKKNRHKRDTTFDFMKEKDTSPVDLVTRRYPGIAVFKPYNTCSQICIYCQRNWEISEVLSPNAVASSEKINNALKWFKNNPAVRDILVTGGDPCVMDDKKLQNILKSLSEISHIQRIRIGTRTLVALPMRWTDEYVRMIAEFNKPGRLEVAVMTHFEHPYEITPESKEAVQKIKQAGLNVYNQAVFTIGNSRRFENSKLRIDLKRIGIDPYYTFNMKGKNETRNYMVPIARILQERKEEARPLPGLDRTDEPVFNLPGLGKNHLRSRQDRSLIMILADGSRVYEFHPWEKKLQLIPTYNYKDVPIYDYLMELSSRGEDLKDYRTIWYYF